MKSKDIDFFKIEDLQTFTPLNRLWKDETVWNSEICESIRNDNIRNGRLLNSYFPITEEEIHELEILRKKGKTWDELEQYFQRPVVTLVNLNRNSKKNIVSEGLKNLPEGHRYIGDSKNGQPHGQGTYCWNNNEYYIGEWKNGLFNGKGTHIKSDGSVYVGEFMMGKYHGNGTLSLEGGRKYIGKWVNGKQSETRCYDNNGEIVGRRISGEWENIKK